MNRAATGGGRAAPVPIRVINDLKRRFTAFPVPTPPFNPVQARPDELIRYGIPRRPDAHAPALLHRVWNRGFGAPLTLRAFRFNVRAVQTTVYRPQGREAVVLTEVATRFETSPNWSGAYITANRGKQFLQIWGMWTIPRKLQLPPPAYRGAPGIDYICADWIGLDGQRLYRNSSLPQIGTRSLLQPNGTTTAQAWVQWWARYSSSSAPVPLGLAVAPGNTVLCVLTAVNSTTVTLIMVNLTTLHAQAVQLTAPTVQPPGGSVATPEIAGATAEWIVERPAIVGQTTRYNLPDYGAMDFDCCVAVEGDSVNIRSLPAGTPQVLRGERLIRMFDVLQNPQRTAFISMPTKLNDTAVRVRYGA